MSKDKDEVVIFDKKIIQHEEVNEDDQDNNCDSDSDGEDIYENYIEDTLKYIEKNMIEYVDTGISLCEYLSIDKIDKFLDKLKV